MMRILQILTIMIFSLILYMPIITFNFEKEAVSEIDNRMLAGNPFTERNYENEDLTIAVENYINDRIGFRNEMILTYTVLNDRIFQKMVHPGYTYGKNGYVFGIGLSECKYGEFHEAFAEMISQIQEYCEARSVPFLFVFNPVKAAVVTEQIPDGINYNRDWVDTFLADLDAKGIHYIDNTTLMREKTEKGECVYNIKYDANHWNDLGAFYGTSNILTTMAERLRNVHINMEEDITVEECLQTSLLVSKFPIYEMVPQITLEIDYEDLSENYQSELELDTRYPSFGYYVNEKRMKEKAPRALVFQGSYMNNYGLKYMVNGFGEYIHIHDYQNVINFSYYFNIFKPDCVIFEVAEYTLNSGYFDIDRMKAMDLNPVLDEDFQENEIGMVIDINPEELLIEEGDMLTDIIWITDNQDKYVWLKLVDNIYDFSKTENGFKTTVLTKDYKTYKEEMKIILSKIKRH